MRTCGSCSLCCTLCNVPELAKAEGIKCRHQRGQAGCTIYETRPASCRSYSCAWLKGGVPKEMKPDQCGVMVEVYPRMVAALLKPGMQVQDISGDVISALESFVTEGKPVVATGQFAKLPDGMSKEEAAQILRETVMEYRNGGIVQH